MEYFQENTTWIKNNDLQNQNWINQYINSFYWSISLVMLIGNKGDTFSETCFSSFTLVLTVGVFAYIISTISTILDEINKDYQRYKNDLGSTNRYMQNKKLSQNVQSRVRSYMEYLYKSSGERNTVKQAQNVISQLPQTLREDITQEINRSNLNKFPNFISQFSQKTQDYLAQYMEETQYVTSENVLNQYQHNIYINYISKGKVEYIYTNQETSKKFQICIFKQGQFLGDYNFISGKQHEFTARCLTQVSIIRIPRKHLIEIIQQNQEDKQKFYQMQDQLSFDLFTEAYTRNCLICGRNMHYEINCNLLNYRPNLITTFLKSQYSQIQKDRVFLDREKRSNVKFNPLNLELMEYLQLVSQKLVDEDIELIEQYCQRAQELEDNYDFYDTDSQQENSQLQYNNIYDSDEQKGSCRFNFSRLQTQINNSSIRKKSYTQQRQNSNNTPNMQSSQRQYKTQKSQFQKKNSSNNIEKQNKQQLFKNKSQKFTENINESNNYNNNSQIKSQTSINYNNNVQSGFGKISQLNNTDNESQNNSDIQQNLQTEIQQYKVSSITPQHKHKQKKQQNTYSQHSNFSNSNIQTEKSKSQQKIQEQEADLSKSQYNQISISDSVIQEEDEDFKDKSSQINTLSQIQKINNSYTKIKRKSKEIEYITNNFIIQNESQLQQELVSEKTPKNHQRQRRFSLMQMKTIFNKQQPQQQHGAYIQQDFNIHNNHQIQNQNQIQHQQQNSVYQKEYNQLYNLVLGDQIFFKDNLFLQFDQMCNFKFYFTKNNLKSILTKYKRQRQRIQLQQKNMQKSSAVPTKNLINMISKVNEEQTQNQFKNSM